MVNQSASKDGSSCPAVAWTAVAQHTLLLLDADPAALTPITNSLTPSNSNTQMGRPIWSYIVSGCLEYLRLQQQTYRVGMCPSVALRVAGPPPSLGVVSHWDTCQRSLVDIADGLRRISPRSVAAGVQRIVLALEAAFTQLAQAHTRQTVTGTTRGSVSEGTPGPRRGLFGSGEPVNPTGARANSGGDGVGVSGLLNHPINVSTFPSGITNNPSTFPNTRNSPIQVLDGQSAGPVSPQVHHRPKQLVLVLLQKTADEGPFEFCETVGTSPLVNLRVIIQRALLNVPHSFRSMLNNTRLDIIKVAMATGQAGAHPSQLASRDVHLQPLDNGMLVSVYHVPPQALHRAMVNLAHEHGRWHPLRLSIPTSVGPADHLVGLFENRSLTHDCPTITSHSLPLPLFDPAMLRSRSLRLRALPDTVLLPTDALTCVHRLVWLPDRPDSSTEAVAHRKLLPDRPYFFISDSGTAGSGSIQASLESAIQYYVVLVRDGIPYLGCAPYPPIQVPQSTITPSQRPLGVLANRDSFAYTLWYALVVHPLLSNLDSGSTVTAEITLQSNLASRVLLGKQDSQTILPDVEVEDIVIPSTRESQALGLPAHDTPNVLLPQHWLIGSRWWCKLHALLMVPESLVIVAQPGSLTDPVAAIHTLLAGPLLTHLTDLFRSLFPFYTESSMALQSPSTGVADVPLVCDRMAVAVTRLVKAIEAKDPYLFGWYTEVARTHQLATTRVTLYSTIYRIIAQFLQWVERSHRGLSSAHDEACSMIASLLTNVTCLHGDSNTKAAVQSPRETKDLGKHIGAKSLEDAGSDLEKTTWKQIRKYEEMTLRERTDLDTTDGSDTRYSAASLPGRTLTPHESSMEGLEPVDSQHPKAQLKPYLRPRHPSLAKVKARRSQWEKQLGPRDCLLYRYWTTRPQQPYRAGITRKTRRASLTTKSVDTRLATVGGHGTTPVVSMQLDNLDEFASDDAPPQVPTSKHGGRHRGGSKSVEHSPSGRKGSGASDKRGLEFERSKLGNPLAEVVNPDWASLLPNVNRDFSGRIVVMD
ncbi:hypothetical protein IWQ61_008494 [Dispira simplex]|nr:hypothetical protein IWQ61_008494 [Dispira simplex]